jgi:hypothetical protein
MLDALGRFVSNVGVPAAITFFMLSQLTPRLDAQSVLLAQANTTLTVMATTGCGTARPTVQ